MSNKQKSRLRTTNYLGGRRRLFIREAPSSSQILKFCISRAVIFQKRGFIFHFVTYLLVSSRFFLIYAKTPHICAVFLPCIFFIYTFCLPFQWLSNMIYGSRSCTLVSLGALPAKSIRDKYATPISFINPKSISQKFSLCSCL